MDKITLAALEATLVGPPTPTYLSLHADPRLAVGARRRTGRKRLGALGIPAHVVPSNGAVGGGGAPDRVLPGYAVALPEEFAGALRRVQPSVVARVERGHCLVDLRCIVAEDDRGVDRGYTRGETWLPRRGR